MKVKYRHWGIMTDEAGNEYVCDADGYGNVLCCATRELFSITKRDSCELPIEIEPLGKLFEED